MKVTVNDKIIDLPTDAHLSDALAQCGIAKGNVATALNGEVVPAAKRAATPLKEGDALLVIQPFYGG